MRLNGTVETGLRTETTINKTELLFLHFSGPHDAVEQVRGSSLSSTDDQGTDERHGHDGSEWQVESDEQKYQTKFHAKLQR